MCGWYGETSELEILVVSRACEIWKERDSSMGKNIIICCDGTGNEYGKNNTNVGVCT